MTAICKTIDIHGGLSRLLDYGSNEEKTSLINSDLQNALDYAKNPLKTILELDDGDRSMLVTGIKCTPETAETEFSLLREKYREHCERERSAPFVYRDKKTGKTRLVQKEPVTAIHLIQSFAESELDPRAVHQIGIDLCERMGWQAVVDTHMNTGHCHNHIIINAYQPDGAHKISMNKKMLMQIRQLSDDIQQEYGIDVSFLSPEKQLERSSPSKKYREWEMQRKSHSWKDRIRMDISAAAHVAATRDDFIEIMQSYGYAIERQTDTGILWWNISHTKKIWDRTLGRDYRLDHLYPTAPSSPDTPSHVIPSERERRTARGASPLGESSPRSTANSPDLQTLTTPKPSSTATKYISTSRYAWDGRRRSDLELLFRKAIAVIRRIRHFYETAPSAYDYNAVRKIDRMEQAITTAQTYHIDSEPVLRQSLHDTGAALNHIKSELRSYEAQKEYYAHLSTLVSEYEEAVKIHSSVQYWKNPGASLCPNRYTKDEIQKNRALSSPITPSQKRGLYLILKKHPEYRLYKAEKGYANISSVDAQNIFRFFSGKGKQPEILIDTDTADRLLWEERNMPQSTPSDSTAYNRHQDSLFQKAISGETPKKQAILFQLRNRANALLHLGYHPERLDGIKKEIAEFYAMYESLSEERHDLSHKYKSLIRLSQQVNFAGSDHYLYGDHLPEHAKNRPSQPDPQKNPSLDPPPKKPEPSKTELPLSPPYGKTTTIQPEHEEEMPL